MAAFARFLMIAFVLLSVVYFALFYHLRASRRDRIEAEWAENPEGDLGSHMSRELRAYETRLRRGLILGVYILPLVAMVATIYFTNYH